MRISAARLGKLGEWWALWLYRLRGYRVEIEDSHPARYAYAAPEVRIGRRLGRTSELSFGVQGMFRDMVGQMVADPLNFAGGWLAKGAGGVVTISLALEPTTPAC